MSFSRRVSLWIIISVATFAVGVLTGRLSVGNHVTPALRTGTLTLVSGDRTEFVVQPDGSRIGNSYATPEMWIDPVGTVHDGDLPACVNTANYGQPIEYGLVSVRPRGDVPGTDQVIWVRCFSD